MNELFLPNGAIFIASTKFKKPNFYGRNTIFFKMKKENSIDIDDKSDIKKIKYKIF